MPEPIFFVVQGSTRPRVRTEPKSKRSTNRFLTHPDSSDSRVLSTPHFRSLARIQGLSGLSVWAERRCPAAEKKRRNPVIRGSDLGPAELGGSVAGQDGLHGMGMNGVA